mmetsp:Transcript_10889/g.25248  ORF Transcript_10889/g.25248 Transcript_10889/m.25248 type:complete len:143 (+) Transcript_10889:1355-1783(+)
MTTATKLSHVGSVVCLEVEVRSSVFIVTNPTISVDLPMWMDVVPGSLRTDGFYSHSLRRFSWLPRIHLHPGDDNLFSATFRLKHDVSEEELEKGAVSRRHVRITGDIHNDQPSISMIQAQVKGCPCAVDTTRILRIVHSHHC